MDLERPLGLCAGTKLRLDEGETDRLSTLNYTNKHMQDNRRRRHCRSNVEPNTGPSASTRHQADITETTSIQRLLLGLALLVLPTTALSSFANEV